MAAGKKGTLIVIAGPTGSGKTGLGITVARHFGSPVIGADSRQIYRGMAVGTAQPMPEQLAQVQHYFVATHEITEHYTCGRYEEEALAILDTLFEKHDVVVAVGGSGLYIKALCSGMDSMPDADEGLRAQLTGRLEKNGLGDLLAQLAQLDPAYYGTVDRDNPQRVMRALEVCIQTGAPYSSFRQGRKKERGFDIIKIGAMLPREELYERINRRVDEMIAGGLEDEARKLYPCKALNALQTVGYREWFGYFDGLATREEAVELIKRNTRRYAKRQMTWFGRDKEITWFDPSDSGKIIAFLENGINLEQAGSPPSNAADCIY